MEYKVEKMSEGYVVIWNGGKTKPQLKQLADSLAKALNEDPNNVLLLISRKACCEHEFLNRE